MSLTRRVLTVVAGACAVLGPAGAASAATLALHDPSGDVWSQDMSGSGYVAAGSKVNTDLVRTSFRHGPRNLVVTNKYVDLRRVGGGFFYSFRLRTNEHVRRFAFISAGPQQWRGHLDLIRPNGDPSGCDGATKQIDYDLDTITVTVPRSCVSNPRWVQFTAEADSFSRDGSSLYTDNPHNDQAQYRGWTTRIRQG